MDEASAFREMISRILTLQPGDDAIVAVKIDVCRKYRLSAVPKNSAILAAANSGERETLRKILLVKPTRTLSGVAPVAVMTSPFPCPHGKCLPCPGGPDHPFKSPRATRERNPRLCGPRT
jgi:elongator complex protein 3